MKNILIAVDGSEGALKAVDYAGHQFSDVKDLRITLLYVLPHTPAVFWDDGHILKGKEKEDREKVIERWLESQKSTIEPVFKTATELLTKRGIKADSISTKTISDSMDIAESILEEAGAGGYGTLVIGRRGLSAAKRFFMGSVTTKIVNHGAGIAVCVVE